MKTLRDFPGPAEAVVSTWPPIGIQPGNLFATGGYLSALDSTALIQRVLVYPSSASFESPVAPYDTLKQILSRLTAIESQLREQRHSSTVYISSLSPRPFRLTRDIPVQIKPEDGSYYATFFDANIATSGETEEEAFTNLKGLLIETLSFLGELSGDELGPEPLRQLAVLREFIVPNAH